MLRHAHTQSVRLQFPEKCVVMVRVYEKNLFGFHAGTYVQGAEGGAYSTSFMMPLMNRPPLPP